MCELTLYRDCDPGSITVSNYFVDEFLAEANDCQIKVYLYLIRMLSARKQTNISDIADKFNHTEKDVCRALRFWEKKGILSLDYDANGGIVGIRLHEPTVRKQPENIITTLSAGRSDMPVSAVSDKVIRPNYNADALREFKNREETPQLIFVAEQYLKKTLSAGDIRSLLFYSDELKFTPELIDYLLQFCVSRGKSNFAYMDKVAIDWAEHGIDTVAGARAYTSSFDGSSNTVTMPQVNKSRSVATSTRRKQTQTMFHQFEQNNYDFNILEQKLLQQ